MIFAHGVVVSPRRFAVVRQISILVDVEAVLARGESKQLTHRINAIGELNYYVESKDK